MTLGQTAEAQTIRAKIRAREGVLGYEANLRALKERLAALEGN